MRENWLVLKEHVRDHKMRYGISALIILFLIWYAFALPSTLFADPYSTVLSSSSGELLSASISKDGQWRFPEVKSVPDKFVKSIVTFEDKRFYQHVGVDVLSLARAVRQNIQAGSVVSGGSTLSMQVIRLSRNGKSRTVFEKALEGILATRLELRYSKEEILMLYASHAPFGGNVVGLEAACWRYFGRAAQDISWGEAALLAVLPNAPALIHPGKNREQLKRKRDRLLDKLLANEEIDAFTCSLAKEEPIPETPLSLPRHARHLLLRQVKEGLAQQHIQSTINIHLQLRVEEIINDHHRRLDGNQIHNAAAIVARVSTGEVLAYVGNVTSRHYEEGNEVDIVMAPRSTGSILKPFLYAAMLDEGKILPKTLLPDVPTLINGFSPKNFSKEYDGAVHADRALIRSLNIPAVNMLRDYRYEKFHSLLTTMGMKTLTKAPDHYGLSLILGGAEGTLWDITGMYASMARTLNNYFSRPGFRKYSKGDFHALYCWKSLANMIDKPLEEHGYISAASVFHTVDALKELYRPGEESGWRQFYSARKIAWKTGTSFGFRDGWAIGITPDYVVGVWVGNADGEGRPGLTGTDAAAPVMFDIFSQLDGQSWFSKPLSEMEKITVCNKSGLRSSSICSGVDTMYVPKSGLQSPVCSYHKRIYLTPDHQYRVHSECEKVSNMEATSWFVLPPVQEYYYQLKNASYHHLPPYRKDCQAGFQVPSMDLVYPKPNARIFIPRDLSGQAGSTIFQLAHQNPAATVFWHLDGEYVGATKRPHQMPLNPAAGWHTLTVIDETGAFIEHRFEVLSGL